MIYFPVLQLEEVMETETYKNAKIILERFDPESKKKAVSIKPAPEPINTLFVLDSYIESPKSMSVLMLSNLDQGAGTHSPRTSDDSETWPR